MNRFTLAFVFAVVAVCGVTTPPRDASAQEILLEGPLAGAPAVRKLVQYRDMRFSLGPQFGYTLLNDYMHNFMVGARLEFNPIDWLGIGLVAYYTFNAPTSLTNYIADSQNISGQSTTPAQTGSNWPSYTGASNFKDQVARLRGVYLLQLGVVPFRGKMSMFEKLFVAIDGEIFLGGGIVHYEDRAYCDGSKDQNGIYSTECGVFDDPNSENDFLGTRDIGYLTPEGEMRETRIGGAFTWGVNFMAYFNEWFAVNLEFRMTPFKWNAGGTDVAGQSASEWEYANDQGSPVWRPKASGKDGDYPDGKINEKDEDWNANMSIALGFIFYLPTEPSISE
jgi:hypothetical protein